jgi:hypothetical protein
MVRFMSRKPIHYSKVVTLLIILSICVVLIMEYLLYHRFQDAGWRVKALIWFIAIYATYDLLRELRKWFDRKKRSKLTERNASNHME